MAKFFQPTGTARVVNAKRARDQRVAGMKRGHGPFVTAQTAMGEILLPIRPQPQPQPKGRVGATIGTLIAPAGLGSVIVRGQGRGLQAPGTTAILSAGHGDHALGSVLLRGQGQGGHPFTTMQSQGRGLHDLVGLGDDDSAFTQAIQASVNAIMGQAQTVSPGDPVPAQLNAAYQAMIAQLPPSGQPIPFAQFKFLCWHVTDFFQYACNDALAALQQAPIVLFGQDTTWGAYQPAAQLYQQWMNTYVPLLQAQQDPTIAPNFTLDSINVLLAATNAMLVMWTDTSELTGIWGQILAGAAGVATKVYQGEQWAVTVAGNVADITANIAQTMKNVSDAANNASKAVADLTPVLVAAGLAFAAWYLLGKPMPKSWGRSKR